MSDLAEARALLQKHFGFREFLEGQERIIEAIVGGHDTVVIMPTGGGKSLCYQLPGMLLDGITIVVSPLIALMKDQVDGLQARGIPATFINSTLSAAEMNERIDAMKRGEYRLLYIAPERFKSERFVQALAPLSVALFAVDEAHCISQWGHDFRPDYMRLKWALKDLGRPQVVALTATATPEVRADIVEQLGLGKFGRAEPRVFVSGFARHNLTLGVTHVKGRASKIERIAEFVRQLKKGIVYCATRKNVEKVIEELAGMGVKTVAYHGGLPDDQRKRAQDTFMTGQCDVAVATNAFGMGIDRPDLRFVVHYDIPGSVEAYYQEAGRAGRDGEPSRCEMLFNYADVRTQEFFIDGANPTREIVFSLYAALKRVCGGDGIQWPIAKIAELVPSAKNEMAVGTALYLLERAQFISREYESGARSYTTRLIEPVKKLDDLEIDYDRLEKKRERDRAKLDQIIKYADHHGCRHAFILRYFGDEEAADECTVCDNCGTRGASEAARLPTEAETVLVQKALSCVARLNGRFGRGRIAQTLVGSRSKDVLDAGLDRLSTYGLLREQGEDYVWSLLNTLIKARCIEVSTGDYPTLSLSPLGWEVMQRKQSIPLVMPSAPPKPKPSSARSKSKTSAAADADVPADYDARLFDTLREWRRKVAAQSGGLPAYLVYTDKTIEELSRVKPVTEEQLMEVRGIGPHKAKRFGAETLRIIREHEQRRDDQPSKA